MTPFSFEELQKILELKPDEIDTDLLIFNSTLFYVENLLGYQLADKNYNELQTVKDCKVYTEQEHILEMISGMVNDKYHLNEWIYKMYLNLRL